MNQASAGDPGVCPQSSGHTSVSTGVSSTHRIPELRSKELRESSNREGELRNQDGSDLRADTREESPSPPPAPKRLKRDTKEKERKQKVDEEDAQKMKLLTSSLSEAQLNHYEAYCRSAFPRAAVKHLIQRAAGTSVAKNVVIAMAGLAKVFVGEVVEEALDVCERWGETPPLQPRHLREAVRRFGSKGKIPNTKSKKILFF